MKKSEYKEGPDSTFTHDGKIYRVDDLLSITEDIKSTKMDVGELDWILEETKIDPKRVGSADLSVPIIVVDTKDWGWVVLDGVHRLSLAKHLDNKTIKVKVIKEKDLPLHI